MNKNKKILFLSRLFHPHIGGVEKHVFEISKLLIQKGNKVTIVTEQFDKKLKEHEIWNRIEIYRIPVAKSSFSKKFVVWSWLFIHKNILEQADVIHCHDVFFWYLPFRFLFPRKKVFTTFHGYESYPLRKKAIIVRKISEVLSFGNISIGEFMKKWYKTKPNFVSYGAVDIEKLKAKTSKFKLKNTALFIGRLDEQTGIKTYIEGARLIKKQVPDFKLTIIGDGEFKSFVQNQAKVIGWQKKPESYFKYARFAFVSRYLSILEAMASKKLVFGVYDNPLKKDYLFLTPFAKKIIIASSPKELSDKVQFFLKHPKQEKKIIEAAYKWAQQQTWKEVVDIYLKLWSFK